MTDLWAMESECYTAMRIFKTEAGAKAFAEAVGSDSWGWMDDISTGKRTWYVEYKEVR